MDIRKNSEESIAILNELANEINESKNHVSEDNKEEEAEEADKNSSEDTESELKKLQPEINLSEEVI